MSVTKHQFTVFLWLFISLLLLISIIVVLYLRWRRNVHYQPLIQNTQINISTPLTLHVCDVVNGIMKLEFTSVTTAQMENNHIDFGLNIFVHHKWHCIVFNEYNCYIKSDAPPGIFIRFPLHLTDYSLTFKVRYKLHDTRKWSKYSTAYMVTVPSLITSSFFVNDVVNYRQQNDFYLKQGLIVKSFDNHHFGIVENRVLRQMDEGQNVDDVLIVIHESRILGNKIHLHSIIDTDHYIENTWSNFLLLRSSDRIVNDIFVVLRRIYMAYAMEYVKDTEATHEMYYIGRYVAKNIMDYVYCDTMNRFMLNCLVDSKDGGMSMYETRRYIINSRMESLQNGVIDTDDLSHIDNLCERCDVCNVGISAFDWILKCPQSVCDYHIICSKCGNNVVVQYMQLMALLKNELRYYLNDDCIHEVVSFTVAPMVQL
eukprot:35939_1